jgi:hypothetical protein
MAIFWYLRYTRIICWSESPLQTPSNHETAGMVEVDTLGIKLGKRNLHCQWNQHTCSLNTLHIKFTHIIAGNTVIMHTSLAPL